MRIRLLMLGKTRRTEMRAILDDYVKRISHWCPVEITEVRDAPATLKKLDADRAATVVLLDAGGKNLISRAHSLVVRSVGYVCVRVLISQAYQRFFKTLS